MTRLLTSLLVLAFFPHPLIAQHVKISVLDRGQADGIVIRTPNHHWVVIDGGTNREQAELMEEWGVTTVDLAVISHRHFDHNGGMDDVLNRFTVNDFVGRLDECPTVSQDNIVAKIVRDSGITAHVPNNQTFNIDGVTFTILPTDPVDDACPGDENDNSVMVRMDYGEFSMLFAGDADENERDWLTVQHAALLDVDVLKAAHHGATNGWSQPWLGAVTPDRVVISAGVNANHKHPHQDAVNGYIGAVGGANHVYCTNRHQTVTVYGYSDGRVRVVRQNPINTSCVYDGTHY